MPRQRCKKCGKGANKELCYLCVKNTTNPNEYSTIYQSRKQANFNEMQRALKQIQNQLLKTTPVSINKGKYDDMLEIVLRLEKMTLEGRLKVVSPVVDSPHSEDELAHIILPM